MPVSQQTEHELAQLALKLAGNPKTRRQFLAQVKQVDPNYRPPADVQLEDFKQEVKREREEEKMRAAGEAEQRRLTDQRQKLLDGGKYTPEQVAEIENTVMKKYGLRDYEAGAKLYAADLAPSRPSNANKMRHGQIWEFPNIPGLLQNPDKAASDAAYAVIDELRAGR